MKKLVAMALTCAMVVSLAACGSKPATNQETSQESKTESSDAGAGSESKEESKETAPSGNVELEVVTTFAGNDSNAQNYKTAYKAWETETGNKVVDMSATSDETFKTRVVTDFETNSEPDVLFFFNGADANSFIEAGKVVSIDDIRKEYPEYASNMDDGRITPSVVDGVKYAVPVNGFWEAMFVNTEILDAAGVTMPGPDYTWEAFKADCQKIADAGYTPIAAALGNIPHYWWEFSIFNHTGIDDHMVIPDSVDSDLGKAWVAGMNDIKELYELGYFPKNTLSATDDETFAMFTDGKAAFLIDGSWKVAGITASCQSDADDESTLDKEKLEKFSVTYVPGTDMRKASDLIGGLSMGYYITKKAWDDPEKRAVAVDFVEYMTSDEVVPAFVQHTASALKNTPEVDASQFNSLQINAMEMIAKSTSFTPAVQDVFDGPCRVSTFDGMGDIVTGSVDAVDAVKEGLDAYKDQ